MFKKLNNRSNGTAIHYSEVDVRTCVDRRIAQIAQELAEVGSHLDPERVFQLEALGYVVDLDTGEIIQGVAVDD